MIGESRPDPHWVHKERVSVRIQFKDGNAQEGVVFVSAEMRILDLLNSYHAFIAFEREDGEFEILNKDLIARIKPLGAW